MEGIVVVNKPPGMTSHDVVHRVRKIFNMRRVGHAGTLDPLATGVLVVLLGKATKLFNRFVEFDKAYRATLRLGTRTTTADIMGKVLEQKPFAHVTRAQVEKIFTQFIGEQEQMPPMVSALKFQGRRLYALAREGKEVARTPRKIRIMELKILDFSNPEVQFFMECTKGTYVRKFAEDAGELLGCGACISQIERTKVGPFTIEQSVALENLNESYLRRWPDQAAV